MSSLDGMKDICNYVNRSANTIIKYINELSFPAVKLNDATWQSDTDLIDDWRKCQIMGIPFEMPKPKKRNKKQ